MDQKLRILVVAFLAIILALGFMYFQAVSAKQSLMQQVIAAKNENQSLSDRASKAQSEAQQLQSRMASLKGELDRLSGEREEMSKRLETAADEKAGLVEQINLLEKKLKASPAPAPAAAPAATTMTVAAPPVPLPQQGDAYWAKLLKDKTDLELQISNIQQELRKLQLANQALLKEKNSLTLELSNLERERSDFKRQMDYNQKIMDSIAAELVREKNDKFQVQEDSKFVKEENEQLRRQLKNLQGQNMGLEKKLIDWQEKNTSLGNRISEMESMLQERVQQIDGLKKSLDLARMGKDIAPKPGSAESIELPPIIVRPAEGQAAAAGIAPSAVGKVLAINRENNFLITDIGEASGIKLGTVFKVWRGDQIAGEIEVIQLRADISACDIKQESLPIKVGDLVK